MKLAFIFFITIVFGLDLVKRDPCIEICAKASEVIRPCFGIVLDNLAFINCICESKDYWDFIEDCVINCSHVDSSNYKFHKNDYENQCKDFIKNYSNQMEEYRLSTATNTSTDKTSSETKTSSTSENTTTKEETSTSTGEKTSESTTTKGLSSGMSLSSLIYLVVLGMI